MAAVPPLTLPTGLDYRRQNGDPADRYVHRNMATSTPRAVVRVYGIATIPKELDITLNAHGVADSASIVLSIAGNPDWSATLKKPTTADGSVVVEIYVGFPVDPPLGFTDTAQLTRIFVGTMQKGSWKATADTVTFECISLASMLMVQKQTTLIQGMTSIQFVAAAAKAAGVGVNIKLRPGQKALTLQAIMSQDHVVGVHAMKAWDLIESCAEADAVNAWVDRNGILQYVAPELENARTIVKLQYSSDLIELDGEHSPQFSKNIQVEVRLWNSHTRTSHIVTVVTDANGNSKTTERNRVVTTTPKWGTKGSTSTSGGQDAAGNTRQTTTDVTNAGGLFKTGMTTIPRESSKERIVLELHDCTPDEALRRAHNEWIRRSRFEYAITVNVPVTAELLDAMTIDSVYQLFGCPWHAFNSTPSSATPNQVAAAGSGPKNQTFQENAPYYFQRRIHIRFAQGDVNATSAEGFTMTAECVNHAIPSGAPL